MKFIYIIKRPQNYEKLSFLYNINKKDNYLFVF